MTETRITSDTRQALLRIGLFAVTQHMLDHDLPVPADIYVSHEEDRDAIRVLVSGAGQQMRWLNTVHIDEEQQEPVSPGRLRMAWKVRMECGIRFELVGHRVGDTMPQLAGVAS